MQHYDFVYAVRNIKTKEMINKRKGNPFFVSVYQARQAIGITNKSDWNKGNYEVVKFRLEEEKVYE